MSLSKNIFKIRRKLGLTQASLAFELEVNQFTVSKYESGLIEPSIEVSCRLLKLARKEGLDIHLEDIVCGNLDNKIKD